MNENKQGTRLDLVNPMNPSQILKSEMLIKEEVKEETIEEEITTKKKKKGSPLLIIVVLLLLIGLGAYYYIMYFNKPVTKPTPKQDTEPVVKEVFKVQDVVDTFNNNISNYVTDKEMIAENIDDTTIRITVTIEDVTTTYDFIYRNDALTLTISADDINTIEVVRYILSCVGVNHDIPFETTMAYLYDNDITTISELNISEVNSMKVIRIDVNKSIIKILD